MNGSNMTNESIKIGTFKEKQTFHFLTLQFIGMSDVKEQGRIIECYLPNNNFLLLPRNNICQHNGQPVYTSLLFIWDEPININNTGDSDLVKALIKMTGIEINIKVQKKHMVINNGKYRIQISGTSINTDDEAGYYSYLVSHRYVNGEYVYRITSSRTFKDNILLLKNFNLSENTILDLVFTGRITNDFNNCYSFNRYKVKDYYIDGTYDKIVLSDVKGIVDLSQCGQSGQIFLYNFLLDWKNPDMTYGYFSNMSIKIVSFLPEEKITFKDNHCYYKGQRLDGRNIAQHTCQLILPKDETLITKMIEVFLRQGSQNAIREFESTKSKVDDIIANFEQERIKRSVENFKHRRTDLMQRILMDRRSLNDIKEKILIAEHRIKDFIPFPHIILPEKEVDVPVCDLMSILRVENNKYILEERVDDNESYE